MKALMKCVFFTIILLQPVSMMSQYFGRTKVNYNQFPFVVLESPHFEIYHYESDLDLIRGWASEAEHWYTMYSRILYDSFSKKNPIVIYDNQAHFQQTHTVSGNLGVGTGGVTEALKNRVVIPLAMSSQQTRHVLGHELVHAFQYHLILSGVDSTNMNNLNNLPLWMVEGLAEYLSIGREDPFTGMWMRDAYLHDQIPPLEKLVHYTEFFPYRYGQAFWAFLTGMYGDEIIRPFFVASAKWGIEMASQRILKMPFNDLSEMWQDRLKKYYGERLAEKSTVKPIGQNVINENNAGYMNVSPAISPNGRYLIFFSEKDLFTVDLYLADLRSGRILGKIASAAKDRMIDNFQFIESSGTWSPNNHEFAFVAFHQGENIIVVKDIFTHKTTATYSIDGVEAISNPAWSPDGKIIVFSGNKDGQTDLYSLDIKTKKTVNLTEDRYSEIHPNWSPDGKYIVYATDQLSMENGRKNGKWTFNLALYDYSLKTVVEQINIFPGADNLNPNFNNDGEILFLSNRDGFRNLYLYNPSDKSTFQMTDYATGISGITPFAPAISVGGIRNSRIIYTYFSEKKYSIFSTSKDELLNKLVLPEEVDLSPGYLPVKDPDIPDLVLINFRQMDQANPILDELLVEKPYRAKFKLDFVGGGGGVGIGAGTAYGGMSYASGGVDLLFGDMLGYHQLYNGLYLNGEIYDFGAAVSYLNQKHRMPWGLSLSHIPYVGARSYYPAVDTFQDEFLALRYTYDLVRIFEDKLSALTYLPFSPKLRLEGGAGAARYSYRIDRYDNWYDAAGYLFAMDRNKQDAPSGFNLFNFSAAVVGDNSYFGIASPMTGYRFRFGADQYLGEWTYQNLLVDGRLYQWLRPISLGVRFMHYARIGRDALNFYPFYIGDPLLVRGYGYKLERLLEYDLNYNQLGGNKFAVINLEARLPFTGPKRLALIPSNSILTEISIFTDGGAAWYSTSDFKSSESNLEDTRHKVIFSSGLCIRFNVFGAVVLEPFYAIPWQKNASGVLGINFVSSGW